MRMWVRILIVSLTGGVLMISCVNAPNKPVPAQPLRLYVSDYDGKNLFVVDPSDGSIIDSITQISPHDMNISPDFRYLYMLDAMRNGDEVRRVDLKTLNLDGLSSGAGYGGILMLVDNGARLIRNAGGRLEHIDPRTMQIIDIDTVDLRSVAGADTVSYIIGQRSRDGKFVCYDYISRKVISEEYLTDPIFGIISPRTVYLAPDGKTGYAIGGFEPCIGRFVAFEVPSFKIFYAQELNSRWGQAIASPNGHYVIVTDPGAWGFDQCVIGDIFVLDLAEKRIVKTIHTGVMSRDVKYSPDGKFAYISNLTTDRGIEVLNMETLELVDHLTFNRMGIAVSDFEIGRAP